MPSSTLYFAYGSNLSLSQMAERCPNSYYVGRAILQDHRWQINNRGYANVVPDCGFNVHGLVYLVSAADEATLDKKEGVRSGCYEKKRKELILYPAADPVRTGALADDATAINRLGGLPEQPHRLERSVLTYISSRYKLPGYPEAEYIRRINLGIRYASALGVPFGFFDNAVRHLIHPRPATPSSCRRKSNVPHTPRTPHYSVDVEPVLAPVAGSSRPSASFRPATLPMTPVSFEPPVISEIAVPHKSTTPARLARSKSRHKSRTAVSTSVSGGVWSTL